MGTRNHTSRAATSRQPIMQRVHVAMQCCSDCLTLTFAFIDATTRREVETRDLDGRCPSLDSSPLSLRATEKFSAVNLERARCASRHNKTLSKHPQTLRTSKNFAISPFPQRPQTCVGLVGTAFPLKGSILGSAGVESEAVSV